MPKATVRRYLPNVMLYEIRIHDFPTTAETLALQTPIAHSLCPEPEHTGPCEVPWGFTLTEDNALVLGIYATREKATELTNIIHRLTTHPTTLHEAAPGHFEELAEQYRIEHPPQ